MIVAVTVDIQYNPHIRASGRLGAQRVSFENYDMNSAADAEMPQIIGDEMEAGPCTSDAQCPVANIRLPMSGCQCPVANVRLKEQERKLDREIQLAMQG